MDYDEKAVGQMLQDVPIGDMIKSYAIGIADAQWELDQKSIAMAYELMNKTITLRGKDGVERDRTLLELGFAPTFYQFQEATIEVAVSLSMRVEQSVSLDVGIGVQRSTATQTQGPTGPSSPATGAGAGQSGQTPQTPTPEAPKP